MHYLYRVSHFN